MIKGGQQGIFEASATINRFSPFRRFQIHEIKTPASFLGEKLKSLRSCVKVSKSVEDLLVEIHGIKVIICIRGNAMSRNKKMKAAQSCVSQANLCLSFLLLKGSKSLRGG